MVKYDYKQFFSLVEKFFKKEKKYFFYGENVFEINFTIEKLLKKIGVCEKETVYGYEISIDEIITKLTTSSLFCQNVVLILKNFEFTKKKFRKALVEFIKNYNVENYFIIVNNGELSYKEIKDDREEVLNFLLNNTVAVEFVNYSKQEILNNFIPSNCTKKINDSAKLLLYENFGDNIFFLHNELKKLSFYKNDDSEITENDIIQCCSTYNSEDIMELFNNIKNGLLEKSLAVLNSLFSNGVEPVYISISLCRYIRNQFLWNKIDQFRLSEVIKELNFMDYKVKTSSHSKYFIELSVIKLCKILGN